ncbi:MAG: hypothetical protein M0027_08450 [Candidatus Dormibacteraeota bacterium]|nr:hypothetical protein [Candidatus Dormibacteraeota bacterium]
MSSGSHGYLLGEWAKGQPGTEHESWLHGLIAQAMRQEAGTAEGVRAPDSARPVAGRKAGSPEL